MKQVILEPVVTEKVSALASTGKTYVFKVNKNSNKIEIKDAIEKTFGVKVESINTLITKPKDKRVGKYTGQTKTYKKAIVALKDGQSIEV